MIIFKQDCFVASMATWIAKAMVLERGHTARAEDTTLIIEGGHLAPQTELRYRGQIEFALGLVLNGDALPSFSQEELWALIG